ncbi:hypothetical protein CP09DC77_1118B, partial [Chlamydia psittaci 09DC77]
LDLFRALL